MSSTESLQAGEPRAREARDSENNALQDYAKLQLSFVENQGEVDKDIAYYAQGAGYYFAFQRDRVLMSFTQKSSSKDDRRAAARAPRGSTRQRVSASRSPSSS